MTPISLPEPDAKWHQRIPACPECGSTRTEQGKAPMKQGQKLAATVVQCADCKHDLT